MINLLIIQGCQSGSVGRGGQLVRLVRLVWWSRWSTKSRWSRWSRLSMRSRWSGLPGWSGWLLRFWWILNNQTRFCSKLTLSDSYLIVVRCNALTTRLVSPLHFIGVTIYHAFLLARELIRVSLAAYCFTFYRVLRFSGVRKSKYFPSCGSHSLFKLHICLSGLYS